MIERIDTFFTWKSNFFRLDFDEMTDERGLAQNLSIGGRRFVDQYNLFDEVNRSLAYNDTETLENYLNDWLQRGEIDDNDKFHIQLYVLNYNTGQFFKIRKEVLIWFKGRFNSM